MTRAETLKRTIELADAWMEREIENAELVLIDCGATEAELLRALGRDGYFRRMLQADRDAQIREVETWLAGNDGTRH
jgi:hypothetical protein